MSQPKKYIKPKYRIQYVMDNNIDHHGECTDYCNYFGKHLFDFDTRKIIPEYFKMFNSKNGSDILLLDSLRSRQCKSIGPNEVKGLTTFFNISRNQFTPTIGIGYQF